MSWSKAFASFASVRPTLYFHFSLSGRTTQESTMSSEETRTEDIATLERPDKKNRILIQKPRTVRLGSAFLFQTHLRRILNPKET